MQEVTVPVMVSVEGRREVQRRPGCICNNPGHIVFYLLLQACCKVNCSLGQAHDLNTDLLPSLFISYICPLYIYIYIYINAWALEAVSHHPASRTGAVDSERPLRLRAG